MGENEAEMEAISKEIELVIRERINRFKSLRYYRGIEDDAHEVLLSRLLEVENRTYLWAALILPELENLVGFSKKKLIQAIQTIPTTIDAAYERILSRSTDIHQAKKLLQIVIGAERPLTLDEINVAMSITSESRCMQDLDLETPVAFRRTVREMCGLIINILDSKIYLMHQTVREFILNSNEQADGNLTASTWKHSMSIPTCNTTLARICVTFLSFSDFEHSPFLPQGYPEDLIEETQTYLGKYAFLEYATKYWDRHCGFATDGSVDPRDILRLCDPKTFRCRTWFQIRWSMDEPNNRHPKGLNEAMIVSYLDIFDICKPFRLEDLRIDAKDYHSRNVLWWALETGSETALQEMITTGIAFDEITTPLEALQIATSVGSGVMIQYILRNYNVYGNTVSRDGWTALRRAVDRGFWAVFKIMVDHEPENIPVEDMHAALFQAATRGKFGFIDKLMSTYTLDLEALSADGETALYSCVACEIKDAVLLLLEYGANPNTLSHNAWHEEGYVLGETPLHRAVSDAKEELVLILLEHGADLEAVSRHSETALYRATSGYASYNDMIVRLLLDRGADINHETGSGDTPLRKAVRFDLSLVKEIMEKHAATQGIDIEAISTAHPRGRITAEDPQGHLHMIEESELVNPKSLWTLLEMDDNADEVDHAYSRSFLRLAFWTINANMSRLRDAM